MSDAEAGFEGAPADLSYAGAVVDKAIEYMSGQNIAPMSIASALLGGALGMLTRALDDESIVRILSQAIGSVRAGEFRADEADGDDEEDGCGRH
jgi:hypothetical protein